MDADTQKHEDEVAELFSLGAAERHDVDGQDACHKADEVQDVGKGREKVLPARASNGGEGGGRRRG